MSFNNRENLINIFCDINSKINLSAIKKPDEIYVKHILDSIELNKILNLKINSNLIDIGTGGGFPLIPLAMTNSNINCFGLDSKNKKLKAINLIIEKLNINNIKLIWSRIEDHKGNYDYITARSVAYIDKLLFYSQKLMNKGTILILYKQFSCDENEKINIECKIHNLIIEHIHHYSFFEGDISRVIYILKKR